MEDQNQNQKTTENPALKQSSVRGAVQNEEDGNIELNVCKKQAEEYLNNWKRERADFVNYKKDEGKRMEEFVKFANESLILELLDTLDDLYLAAEDLKNTGLDQVIKKFVDLLKKYGVEKIKIGDPSMSSGQVRFDPMYQEIVEGTEGDKIEEVRAGYTMYGRVIRPARVRVIK